MLLYMVHIYILYQAGIKQIDVNVLLSTVFSYLCLYNVWGKRVRDFIFVVRNHLRFGECRKFRLGVQHKHVKNSNECVSRTDNNLQ